MQLFPEYFKLSQHNPDWSSRHRTSACPIPSSSRFLISPQLLWHSLWLRITPFANVLIICIRKGVQPAPYSSMNELFLRDQQLHSNTDDVGGQTITFPNLCVQISVFTGFSQQSVFMQDISHTQQLFFLFSSVEFSNLQSEVFFIMDFLTIWYQGQGYIHPIPLTIIPFQNVSSGCWFLFFVLFSCSLPPFPTTPRAAKLPGGFPILFSFGVVELI